MRFAVLGALFLALFLGYLFWPKANLDAIFPNSPGRESFLARCSGCHSPELVLLYREQGGRDVQGLILKMQKLYGMGALSSSEHESIRSYLEVILTAQDK